MDEPPRPSARAIRAVELKHTAHTVIFPCGSVHHSVLFDGSLGEPPADIQYLRGGIVSDLECLGDALFRQFLHFDVRVVVEPFEELIAAVGVAKPRDRCGFLHKMLLFGSIYLECPAYKFPVEENPVSVDLLIGHPFRLQRVGNGERRKTAADLHFRHNVLCVVCLERFPLFWIVLRQIARPATIALRWLARQTKITNKGFAACALFLILCKSKSLADFIKPGRVAEIESVELRACPLPVRSQYTAAVQTV